MGNLTDVVIQTGEVETAGGSFTVSPLTGADILGIFLGHKIAVDQMYDSFKDGVSQQDIFVSLVVHAPEIVADIIARAAGQPDDAGISAARKLDVGAQLMALEKIGALTVSSVGGLGNLAALIERLTQGANQGIEGAKTLSEQAPKNGSTTSEGNAQT